MPIPSDASQVLEEIIDASSLDRLLELIADVCHEKAEHLRSNWQDEPAAKTWERDAAKLLKLRFEN